MTLAESSLSVSSPVERVESAPVTVRTGLMQELSVVMVPVGHFTQSWVP